MAKENPKTQETEEQLAIRKRLEKSGVQLSRNSLKWLISWKTMG